MIQPWTRISSTPLGNYRVFSVSSVLKRAPRTGQTHDFFVINSVNWVNVIAITPDQRMVLVEQFRQGSDTVELEVPGGMMDAKDGGPEEAAVRELREETGCTGEKPRIIGQVYPNPALMSNICYSVLLENCRVTGATEFDHTEDLITKLVPVDEVPGLVAAGKIRHALVVVAIFHYELWRKGARQSA